VTLALELREVSKRYPGVLALDRVSFDLRFGEIHALVGENGAGKSTLVKVAVAMIPEIAVVYQELSLVPEFSIAENIFLGREPRRFGIIDRDAMIAGARRVLDQLQIDLDPHTITNTLGIGQQHLVEIAKALARDATILVLDEPTAALTDAEAGVLFGILERLRASGVAIAYISHKLGEVLRIADRITVLRDGRAISTDDASALDAPTLITRMVGRAVSELFPVEDRRPRLSEVIFEARNVNGISLNVRRGEVLGIAGLVGAGRSDLLMAMFGADPERTSGEFFVEGKRVTINSPADAIAAGIAFVTEDRKRYGVLLDQTVNMNLTLASLRRFANRDDEIAASQRAVDELRIKTTSLFTIAGTLSGGNQQKVVLAKWLLTNPKVLLLDEPTRGIDVGAKQEIYQQIRRLASEGMAIVLVSSELPEVLGLSDRVIVIHKGRVAAEFARADATAENVMAAATGQVTA